MAAHGALRLLRMNANLSVILGVEALCAAQGLGFRAPLQTSAPLQAAIGAIRAVSPSLTDDRYLAPDIEAATALIRGGQMARAAGIDFAL
jgi:histidine ammonia-lyase